VERTFDDFLHSMNWYIDFLNKVFAAQRVLKGEREKKEVLEAFVFKIHVTWGIFIEELLIDCLNRDTSQYANYMALKVPKHLPRSQCKAILTGLRYVDFRSVSEIKKVAQDILVPENNPFKAIPKSASDKIDEFYKIRNYLAHYSGLARRSLAAMYKRAYGMRRFREPGDFLYSLRRRKDRIRLADYIEAFRDAAEQMGNFLGIWEDDNPKK
jgi:hypothetical protein